MIRPLIVSIALVGAAAMACAQVQRAFPQHALRGQLSFTDPPEVLLNSRAARMAPGSRIRGQDNMLKTPASMAGAKLWVHYTVDSQGLVFDIWVLRDDELAKKPWPSTPSEARAWQFDPAAQVWGKP